MKITTMECLTPCDGRTRKRKKQTKKTIGHNASFRELLPEQFLTVLRVCIYTQRKRSKSDLNVQASLLIILDRSGRGTMKVFDSRPRRLHVHLHFFISPVSVSPLGIHLLRKETPFFFLPQPILPCPTKGKKGTQQPKRIEAPFFFYFFSFIKLFHETAARTTQKKQKKRHSFELLMNSRLLCLHTVN